MKRWLSLILACLCLMGCGVNAEQAEDVQEIVLSVLGGVHPGMSQGLQSTPVMDEIAKKTGVRLELNAPAAGTLHEQLALQLASNSLMDLTIRVETTPLERAGKAVDLDPLIEEYAPNIKAKYESLFPFWRISYAKDNKLYKLWNMTSVDSAKKPPAETSLGLAVRYDLLKEIGLPEIATTEDWFNVLKALKEKFPTVDGKEVYPYATFLGEDWSVFWSLLIPFSLGQGHLERNGTYFLDDGTCVMLGSREDQDVFWNAMRFFNRMYKEGLFDPQSFELTFDQLNEKIKSGRVYSFSTFADYADSAETYWQSKPETHGWTFAFPNVRTAGYDGKTVWDISAAESLGDDNISITTANKYPVETIKFLDFLASDEGQLLAGRGIEGVHYDIDASGKYEMKADVMNSLKTNENYIGESGVGAYRLLAQMDSVNAFGQSNWWFLDPGILLERYSDAQREAYAWQGQTLKGDTMVRDAKDLRYMTWTNGLELPDYVGQIFSQIFVATVNTVPKAILAETDEEFERVMESHYRELETIGAAQVRDYYQSEYDAHADLIDSLK